MNDKTHTRLTIAITVKLRTRLRKESARRDLSMSKYILELIECALNKVEPDSKERLNGL